MILRKSVLTQILHFVIQDTLYQTKTCTTAYVQLVYNFMSFYALMAIGHKFITLSRKLTCTSRNNKLFKNTPKYKIYSP